MSLSHAVQVRWSRIGGISGVSAVLSYFGAAFVPMPEVLTLAAAFAFGPLLAVACVGLHCATPAWSGRPLTQIAAGFGVAAGATVLAMLTVQQAIFATLADAGAAGADAQAMARLAHAVHLGLDVAWDVLISTAVILFGLGMLGLRGVGGVVMGVAGVLLGGLLLAYNLWYFPQPPADAQSIDWGPLVALWLLTGFTMLLARRPWLVRALA
ncbi:MAG: hypothetical protein U1F26_02445 [Lysobacterales bacterium]